VIRFLLIDRTAAIPSTHLASRVACADLVPVDIFGVAELIPPLDTHERYASLPMHACKLKQ
jgi:hypothetical protein